MSLFVAGISAGCAGAQITPAGVTAQSVHASRLAASENLLYISDPGAGRVFVYQYLPARTKRVGFLTDATTPQGLCVDKAQNVFVTDSSSLSIFKYAHGGSSPIATLNDPAGYPHGCAVDPASGNLAVASFSSSGGSVELAVYTKARGKPALYSGVSFTKMYFCAYDKKGNLFVDGSNDGTGFLLAELPKGAAKLRTIILSQFISGPGGVQWAGDRIAIGDVPHSIIYQFYLHKTAGALVGYTPLHDSTDVLGYYIDRDTVINPSSTNSHGSVSLYDYPLGGNATLTLTHFRTPYSVVVSAGTP